MSHSEDSAQVAAHERHLGLRASLLVLAAIVIVLAPAMLQPDGLIYPAAGAFSDLTITHWPALDYLRQSFERSGVVPLWRTSILGGTPFAADPVVGLWYPPNWLGIVVPLEWFFKMAVVAHLFLGGWSMMRLARTFEIGWIGSTASGIAYAIAPSAVGHAGAGHITLVEAWAWIPVAVWGVRSIGQKPWAGPIASGLALGLCMLADARVAVYAGGIVAVYVAASHIACAGRLVGYWVMRATGLLAIAAWVSAAAWVPALSLAHESTRASLSLAEAGAFSLPPEFLLGTVLAGRGDVERLTYVGLVVLILALVGLRTIWVKHRRVAAWLIVLAGLGVLAALGVNGPLYPILYSLPGVSLLRVPSRAWLMVAFAAAFACGFGLDAVMRSTAGATQSRSWKVLGLMSGSFALLFGVGGAFGASRLAGAERLVPSMLGLAVFVPVTLGAEALRRARRLSARQLGVVVTALLTLDLAWVGWGHYRVVTREQAFVDGAALAEVVRSAAGGDPFRVYSPSYSLPQHVAQAYGLERVDGIDPLQLDRTVRFMQRATGVGAWAYSVTVPAFAGLKSDDQLRTLLAGIAPDPRLLGMLNVKYVVAHFPIAHPDLEEIARREGAFVYENRRVMPRAWVVDRVTPVADQAQALDWLMTHDASVEAVVEGGDALQVAAQSRDALILLRDPDRILVSARGPGLLVMSEVFEQDWRAMIDGAPARIVPTNAVLRGVYLPDGAHRVEFVFDPMGLKLAVLASALGMVTSSAGWWAARRRSSP